MRWAGSTCVLLYSRRRRARWLERAVHTVKLSAQYPHRAAHQHNPPVMARAMPNPAGLNPCPEETASAISRTLFLWNDDLIRLGYSRMCRAFAKLWLLTPCGWLNGALCCSFAYT